MQQQKERLKRSQGTRSNCVTAGFMETEMTTSLSTEQKNRIFNRAALRKATLPISVARTVEFLLSDAASSITRENIFVDAGTR